MEQAGPKDKDLQLSQRGQWFEYCVSKWMIWRRLEWRNQGFRCGWFFGGKTWVRRQWRDGHTLENKLKTGTKGKNELGLDTHHKGETNRKILIELLSCV